MCNISQWSTSCSEQDEIRWESLWPVIHLRTSKPSVRLTEAWKGDVFWGEHAEPAEWSECKSFKSSTNFFSSSWRKIEKHKIQEWKMYYVCKWIMYMYYFLIILSLIWFIRYLVTEAADSHVLPLLLRVSHYPLWFHSIVAGKSNQQHETRETYK